jgi:hypothetical protein
VKPCPVCAAAVEDDSRPASRRLHFATIVRKDRVRSAQREKDAA